MLGNKPHKAYKSRKSAEEVARALKARYKAQRKAEAEVRQERTTVRMMSQHDSLVPAKGSSKPGKLTARTSQSYGANTLRTCPGGARDEARSGAYAAYLKQVDHPETGCIVVNAETNTGKATLNRLARSAQNANTTSW